MKVDFDIKNNKINNNNKVNFEGYKPVKDNVGVTLYEFNYPYDADRYDCYLEVCSLAQDSDGNYYVNEGLPCASNKSGYYKLKPNKNRVDLAYNFGLRNNQDFAYHYALVPKNSDRNDPNVRPIYKIDAGDYIDSTRTKGDHEIYNIVTANSKKTINGGAMKLLIPDAYNPLWIYDKDGKIVKNPDIKNIRNMTKTFANKVGGTLAGIEKDVRDGKFDGYERIITTPIFTDDSLSSHGYWNKNCMQMVHSLGNINNYASLQREMFKKGINFVSDGAFVNEGLEGIHFKHVLKWGERSPYFDWFLASNLKNGPFTLGVYPKNHEMVSHKLVNAPFICVQDPKSGNVKIKSNQNYDEKKPTYFQIFDKRLVSDEHQKDTQYLIKKYDRQNTENPLDINTHNDTLIPYSFEINPKTYIKNIKVLNEYNANHKDKFMLDSYMGTRFVSKFPNFELEEKIEGKVDNWDANTDIVKLNILPGGSEKEVAILKYENDEHEKMFAQSNRKHLEVQDYIITSGKYWTAKTSDILTLYTAQQLKAIDPQNPSKALARILENIDSEKFPAKLKKEVNAEIIKNVFNGKYELTGNKSQLEYKNELLRNLMELPLDSIEFGDNLSAVFASPYITKRATAEYALGSTRYEMYKLNNPHLLDKYRTPYIHMDKIYEKELNTFASEIIDNLNEFLPEGSKIYEGFNATQFGKYVLPQLADTITKFAVIKALVPDAEFKVNPENGEISYDYDALKSTTLETLGIYASSPEDEAEQVLNKLQQGIKRIKDHDKKDLTFALFNTLKGTNEYSFKLAEMIVDRLNAGLDWRIDATKDIANMDALRDGGKEKLDNVWTDVTSFWTKFSDNVYSQNPNSYIVAEITDEDTLYNIAGKDNQSTKYSAGYEMVKKFIRETGMTAIANYSYYFSSILNLFGKHFDPCDRNDDDGFNEGSAKRMSNKSYEFFEKSPLKSILGSYNFIGNHDKPRTLHGLIINTDWYNQDLNNINNFAYREKAYRFMHGNFLDPTIPRVEGDTDDTYNTRLRLIIDKADLSNADPKTLALVESLQKGFEKAINTQYPYDKKREANEKITGAIYKSLGDISKGNYLGKNFSSEGFGIKPVETAVDIILNQARKHNMPLSADETTSLKNATIKAVLDPALSKLVAMTEVLSIMPGMPTLYAGDDLGATGYESSSKNMYLQNRGYIRREWAAPRNKDFEFIRNHYTKMNDIMAMRSRPELHAMNDGAPFMLAMQHAKTVNDNRNLQMTAFLRQATDGSVVVSMINTAGINKKFNEGYNPIPVKLERIDISNYNDNSPRNFSSGLTQGTILYNAKDPKDTYMVKEFNGNCFIKRVTLKPDGNIKEEKDTIIDGTTLTLYSKPKRAAFNKKFATGPIKYNPPSKEILGEKLYYLAG